MVGPWVVADAVVDGIVGVAGALGAELPDGPVFSVFLVEEVDEAVERVAVCELRVCLRRARAVRGARLVLGHRETGRRRRQTLR